MSPLLSRCVRAVCLGGAAAAAVALGTSCASAVQSTYAARGYDAAAPQAVKRIVVAAWAPADRPGLAELTGRIATDLVRLRKNYLAHDPVVLARDWDEACGALEGVLSIRTLDVQHRENVVTMQLAAELHSCRDGNLLWRAEGLLDVPADDANLTNLTEVYRQQLGDPAKLYAAPTFAVLQALIGALPDVVLNDEEVLEKIELG